MAEELFQPAVLDAFLDNVLADAALARLARQAAAVGDPGAAVMCDGDAERAAVLLLLVPEGARRVTVGEDDHAVIGVAGAPDVVLLIHGHRLNLVRAALV